MTEYIDRHEAVVVVSRPVLTRAELRRFICQIPTADVRPNIRAKWEINCDGWHPYCSNCKQEPQGRIMTDFCPNCGADMREDKA